MKMKKAEIWLNGRYLETCRDRRSAEIRIARYKREDEYAVKVEKYAPYKAVYEIK